MSGRISIGFVDFPAFPFEFDRVRCAFDDEVVSGAKLVRSAVNSRAGPGGRPYFAPAPFLISDGVAL